MSFMCVCWTTVSWMIQSIVMRKSNRIFFFYNKNKNNVYLWYQTTCKKLDFFILFLKLLTKAAFIW